MKLVVAFALMMLWQSPSVASVCPSFIWGFDLPGGFEGRIKDLKLFAKEGRYWSERSVQVDSIDESGHTQFFEDDSWQSTALSRLDRISIAEEDFGRRLSLNEKRPCSSLVEVEREKRYAYLGFCKSDLPKHVSPKVRPNLAELEVATDRFRYRFSKENHLLFREFFVSSGQHELLVAHDAFLKIKADVKNFFTLKFDKTDVEANLEKYRASPIALVGQLNFFLKILFFRIQVELKPEVMFFNRSAFVPMVMTMPVEGTAYLNHGSGLQYAWTFAPETILDRDLSKMPLWARYVEYRDWRSLAKLGEQYCIGDDCFYRLVAKRGDRWATFDFKIPRTVVARGFFPVLVAPTDPNSSLEKGEVGIFFESSGLAKGSYQWEFWLQVDAAPPRDYCPTAARVRSFLQGGR
ncbi:MAG: hypothetical protein AB7T49_08565 [Oligoflexales bacterium]